MQAKPIILARSIYDFDTLFKTAKQVLGYNINKNIDNKRLQKDNQKFYAALSEFRNEDYQHSPEMEGAVLDFGHYVLGFVVEDEVYYDLLHFRQLSIIKSDTIKRGLTFVIASANLRGWRDAVVEGSVKDISTEVRLLMNSIYGLFSTEGLSHMWSFYSKFNLQDSGMILVPQK